MNRKALLKPQRTPRAQRDFMVKNLIGGLLAILLVMGCEQSPTTLDTEPWLEDKPPADLSVSIIDLDYDFPTQQFFFSVAISGPADIVEATAELSAPGLTPVLFSLNDLGQDADILVHDGQYDAVWTLPDSLTDHLEDTWTLSVEALDAAATRLGDQQTLKPQRPAAPLIGMISHLDTMVLSASDLVLDTLKVAVSHPGGLDEIRSVTMMSLKPDGSYANGGQPIPLYDDGGQEVFYSFGGIDFTSGDSLANDGIYSLLLALAPNNLSGTYHWSFHARTWMGIEALPVEDSLLVLPAGGLLRPAGIHLDRRGVFQ